MCIPTKTEQSVLARLARPLDARHRRPDDARLSGRSGAGRRCRCARTRRSARASAGSSSRSRCAPPCPPSSSGCAAAPRAVSRHLNSRVAVSLQEPRRPRPVPTLTTRSPSCGAYAASREQRYRRVRRPTADTTLSRRLETADGSLRPVQLGMPRPLIYGYRRPGRAPCVAQRSSAPSGEAAVGPPVSARRRPEQRTRSAMMAECRLLRVRRATSVTLPSERYWERSSVMRSGCRYEGQPGHAVPDGVEMREGRAAAGSYTDDTQMMIALAESLRALRRGGRDRTWPPRFARILSPSAATAPGTRTVMSLWAAGVPVCDAAEAELMDGGRLAAQRRCDARRARRGALCRRRAAESPAKHAAARWSRTRTPEGVDGAVVQAVAVAAALSGREPLAAALAAASTEAMRCRLRELSGSATRGLDPRCAGWRGTVPSPSQQRSRCRSPSLSAAAPGASRRRSRSPCAAAGTPTPSQRWPEPSPARASEPTSIPTRWYDALEDAERGRTHVERLAIALIEAPDATDLRR